MARNYSSESLIKWNLRGFGMQNYAYALDDRMCMAFMQTSVLPKWKNWITKRLGNSSFVDKWPYKLRIIDKEYEVHLVSFMRRMDTQLRGVGGYSFIWNNNGAIFTNLDGFSQLEKCIREENLEKFVNAIQTWQGRNNAPKGIIKIVTFKQIDSLPLRNSSLLPIFDRIFSNYENISLFNVCHAFPWFLLPIFDKQSVNNEFFVGLITFLQCQRELCYDMKCEFTLNMIELCSLKLAFCPEFGIESQACTELASEIDNLIIDSLNRLVKKDNSNRCLRNNHFNLIQYANDRKFDLYTQELACFYFIYYFQDWFTSITIPRLLVDGIGALSINLVEEHKLVLSRLRKHSKIGCEIDGTNFSGMDFKLFSGILKHGNVRKIILDTNYSWLNANELKDMFINKKENLIERKFNVKLEFIGENKFNFIADCIDCLQFISTCKYITLSFNNPKISNFAIFKNLHVSKIIFRELTLTSSILHELIACKLATIIVFEKCRILYDATNTDLTLFNEIKSYKAEIIEDEKTWQSIFDSIVNNIQKSRLSEFRFRDQIGIRTSNGRLIQLKPLKFKIIDWGSRLVIRDGHTNKTVDLFDLKMGESGETDYEEIDSEELDGNETNSKETDSEKKEFLRIYT